MKASSPLLLGSLLAALAAGPLLAQQQAQPRAPIAPECRAEIVKLCGEDRTQRRACLMEKRGQLSEGCQTALRQMAEQRRARRGMGGGAPAPAPSPAPAPTASPAPQQ
jgi:hypothetical protein